MSSVVDIATLIDSTPGIYGGLPRLVRSGLPIIQIAAGYQSGMRVPELQDAYPYVDEVSLYAGIAYYLANREDMDGELRRREQEAEAIKRSLA